jgi:hypothetical protein
MDKVKKPDNSEYIDFSDSQQILNFESKIYVPFWFFIAPSIATKFQYINYFYFYLRIMKRFMRSLYQWRDSCVVNFTTTIVPTAHNVEW